jgi:hypothetical protein
MCLIGAYTARVNIEIQNQKFCIKSNAVIEKDTFFIYFYFLFNEHFSDAKSVEASTTNYSRK